MKKQKSLTLSSCCFFQIFIFGGIVNNPVSDIIEIFDGKRRVLEPFLDISGNPITVQSLTSLVSSCSIALVSLFLNTEQQFMQGV